MTQYFLRRSIAALGSTAVLAVSAQSAPQGPATASSAVPQTHAVPYSSTLDRYQPFSDEKILPWKQANDTVREIGGWRAYAKEAQDAEPKAGQPPRGDSASPGAGSGKQ